MMQYYKPDGEFFVGDCMPFSHAGIFHVYYLLDENHHQGNGGLGGHQWAHCSTKDLINWTHHPLAIPISEVWEGSICTGSLFRHEEDIYAFYAVRKPDHTQHLCMAVSTDGISFEKQNANPFLSAPASCRAEDFRDPFVFEDKDGRFHMLVTSRLREFPLHDRGGCLLHLQSDDLKNWTRPEVFLVPGGSTGYNGIPECPDYFFWNGWYYLLFGLGLKTHYRLSRDPFGPWIYPPRDTLGTGMEAVMKTAPFNDNRRLGAAWIACRKDNRNDGDRLWGGNLVVRELIQNSDGTLDTCRPCEMLLHGDEISRPAFTALTPGAHGDAKHIRLQAAQSEEVAALRGLPLNYRFTCRVSPTPGTACFGFGIRGTGQFESVNSLMFYPQQQRIVLGRETVFSVSAMEEAFRIEVVVDKDIIDVEIAGLHSIVDRLPEFHGDSLFFSCMNGSVEFDEIKVFSLIQEPQSSGTRGD